MKRFIDLWWRGRFLEFAACRLMGHEPVAGRCTYCECGL